MAGFNGNRLVVLTSADVGAGLLAGSLVVLICSISPGLSGRSRAGAGIGAVGGADATGGSGRSALGGNGGGRSVGGGGWDVGSRIRWVVRCVGAYWLDRSDRFGAGGRAAGPTPRTNRGPRCGSPIVIAWPSRMSIVDIRAPSTKMPSGLLSMATQWVPLNRSTRTGRAVCDSEAGLPGRSSGTSH